MSTAVTVEEDETQSNDNDIPKQRLLYQYETYIWLVLVLVLLIRDPKNHTAYLCLAHFAIRWLNEEKLHGKLPLPTTGNPQCFRQINAHGDRDGIAAATVLVPVMMEAMLSATQKQKFATYAQTYALSLFTWGHIDATLILSTVYSEHVSFGDLAETLLFLTCWISFYSAINKTTFLHQVFSWGEWMIVTSLISICTTEVILRKPVTTGVAVSDLVAIAGLVGSVAAFSLARWASKSIWVRSVIIVVLPLLFVEASLRRSASKFTKNYLTRKTFPWLWDYMKATQTTPFENRIIPTEFSTLFWVMYNAVVLAIMIPLSSRQLTGVSISRKWFHLLVVLLFLPTTLSAPQFQLLSYAVGGAVLLLLEAVREKIPPVSRFYEKYLDETKGESCSSVMIISHLALLVGCAAPLWVSRSITNLRKPHIMQVLLGVWGVISIGIGDAVGAIVGKHFGKRPWGYQRTMEGSLAMAMSMFVSYGALAMTLNQSLPWSVIFAFIAAVIFATVLEAYTMQNDNLVVPMAGLTMMLLVHRILAGPDLSPREKRSVWSGPKSD